jgi:hypothetical protein
MLKEDVKCLYDAETENLSDREREFIFTLLRQARSHSEGENSAVFEAIREAVSQAILSYKAQPIPKLLPTHAMGPRVPQQPQAPQTPQAPSPFPSPQTPAPIPRPRPGPR